MSERRLHRPSNLFSSSRFPYCRSRVALDVSPPPSTARFELGQENTLPLSSSGYESVLEDIQINHIVPNDNILMPPNARNEDSAASLHSTSLSMFQLSYPTIMTEQMKMLRNRLMHQVSTTPTSSNSSGGHPPPFRTRNPVNQSMMNDYYGHHNSISNTAATATTSATPTYYSFAEENNSTNSGDALFVGDYVNQNVNNRVHCNATTTTTTAYQHCCSTDNNNNDFGLINNNGNSLSVGRDDVTMIPAKPSSHYQNNDGRSMPMTLVETISFSTSDFTENFLTCPTCLCSYDEQARLPRLLPCSHTICRECLERIICAGNGTDGSTDDIRPYSNPTLYQPPETIRCPVCREDILMPRGGLDQLPPSYLVNRLMDLVKSRKSRDYIPKCTIHKNECLLFCETCDCVFCPVCDKWQHSTMNKSESAFSTIPPARLSSITANRSPLNLTRSSSSIGHGSQNALGNNFSNTNEMNSQKPTDATQPLHSTGLYEATAVAVVPSTPSTAIAPSPATTATMNEHLVVPFSIAIKRVAEIVNYKSGQCTQLLDNAVMAIRQEMERLETSVMLASEALDRSFDDIVERIQKRKTNLRESLSKLKDQKMLSLTEQLEIVQAERKRLEFNNLKLLRNPDIRKLTDQIQSLNSQVESGHLLAEPRENSFIKFEIRHNECMNDLSNAIQQFGRIKVSNTYPPLCTARVDGSVTNVRCTVNVTAMDYNGNVQNVGGDPLTVTVTNPNGQSIDYQMEDTDGGSYNVSFLPDQPGKYMIDVKIFNRPIRGSPLSVNISEHNNPIWISGSTQSIDGPVDLLVIENQFVFVLDCCNKQIAVISADTGHFLFTLCTKPYITATTTSFCKIKENVLCTVDWKCRKLQLIQFNLETLEKCGLICPATAANRIVPSIEHCEFSVREIDSQHCFRDMIEPVAIRFAPQDVDNNEIVRNGGSPHDHNEYLGCLIVLDTGAAKLFFIDIYSKPVQLNQDNVTAPLTAPLMECRFRNAVQLPTSSIRSFALSPIHKMLLLCTVDARLYSCRITSHFDKSVPIPRRIRPSSLLKGCFTAMHFDCESRLLASRCDSRKNPQCTIGILNANNVLPVTVVDGVHHQQVQAARPKSDKAMIVDSYSDFLKRPYSLTTDSKGHVYCADYGSSSVRKYRYA